MSDPRLLTEHLFRTKYGEILAVLLRRFGYENFDRVEEAVQLAFQRALEKWPYASLPDNPGGWLYAVARNAYLESARRQQTEQIKVEQLQRENDLFGDETGAEFDEAATMPDDLAAMILLCCNPDLSPKAQVCLTLKAACGFSVKEIARALGAQEETTKKTITRAKEKVAADRAALQGLNADRIAARFPLVLDTLYAMFTEGYAASGGDSQLRRDVAEEAIRLADIFLHTALTPAPGLGDLQALIALMLLQFARFDARTNANGVPLRLQEQDRARWNHAMIRAGLEALKASQSAERPTIFHLEARIAAAHSTSPSFEATDWPTILSLYDQLLMLKDTPEVRLSRCVVLRYVKGWAAALAELERLEAAMQAAKTLTVARSFLLHAVRADLLEAAGRPDEAAGEWQKAGESAPTAADQSFIQDRLTNLA